MRTRAGMVVALAFSAGAVLAVAPARAACSWPFVFEADTFNIAYPDTSATYWLARFTGIPGARLKIEGTYPAVRYFSFHAYDEAQRPVGALADHEILPEGDGANPFVTPGAPSGDDYTAFVAFTGAPTDPEVNTLYAGAMSDGTPNPTGTIIYRVYVPDDSSDHAGGQPLPRITLETADGAVALPLEPCEPLPPSTGGGLTRAIRDSSFPEAIPRALPWPPAQNPPEFVKFYSLFTNLVDRFPPNPATDALPRPQDGGFLSNLHINYLFALTARTHGEVFAFRAKAPSAPDTRGGVDVTTPADLRYWSVCQNNFVTQRFVACLADHEIELDEGGTFTIVVSDPDHRPSNAANWLAWGGPHYDGNVIYRHMLPASGFEGAIQNVPYGTHPREVMGAYYPESAYCDRSTFEAGGFDACSG